MNDNKENNVNDTTTAPDLRAAWQRIITNHQLDVPQLLWAHKEIERLNAEIARQRRAMTYAGDLLVGLQAAFREAAQMDDIEPAMNRILIWARGVIASMPTDIPLTKADNR